ncbi:MAG: uroporphyrinogen-III C-methyltransferase [Methanomassiliicoccales archaeon]|nr:MAG: uroporphyrinogen-III C-methyltransferase [Methanomassiliicoccales archaeon]
MRSCERTGEVYLVGAGPGDPGLITVRGRELITKADVIVHDSLIGMELLEAAREDAEVIDVGKRGAHHKAEQPDINRLLIEKALEGKMVVRLKGGDPFLFGRGGEEAEELVRHGIRVHLVPGVTSSIAVPGLAGIPLTHRDHASMVTIMTGHEGLHKDEEVIDYSLLARLGGTIVIMMGMSNLEKNMSRLIEGGMDPTTPVSVIEKGSTPEQRMVSADVATIAQRCKSLGVGAPAVVVVGGVASLWKTLGDLS